MGIKISTGLRNGILGVGSVRGLLDLGFINIYDGTVPADADASIASNTLLCTISVNALGTGISFDTAAIAGVLQKAPAEIWKGTNVTGGTAVFYRHVGPTDTGASSTTEPRIQGLIATAGADLNFTSTTLTGGATQTIDYYSVAMPSL